MAHITADRVRDTSTSTGTGSFVVSAAPPLGYRTLSTVLTTSDTFYYCISHQTANEWEVGLGTWSGSSTFARTTVYSSSNSGSAVTFSAGTKDVFLTLAADRSVQLNPAGSIPIKGTTSGAVTLAVPAIAGSNTLTLPAVTGNIITSGDSATVTQTMLASGIAGNGPAFFASLINGNVVQSITTNVWTKAKIDTKTFDTASCFDTTNYRFTPNVAGYYLVTWTLDLTASASTVQMAALYKNGTGIFYSGAWALPSGTYNFLFGSSAVVFMNGTTDYLEVYGKIVGTSPGISYGDSIFSGALIRSA